jgi:putative NADH-flavin reductase
LPSARDYDQSVGDGIRAVHEIGTERPGCGRVGANDQKQKNDVEESVQIPSRVTEAPLAITKDGHIRQAVPEHHQPDEDKCRGAARERAFSPPAHVRDDMPTNAIGSESRPRHVAVVGAAGGLGQGILSVCRDEGIGFTAIVRSRPERITDVPPGSRVALVTSLADHSALTAAFSGADAVLTALGVTSTSRDHSALLSLNMDMVEQAMNDAGLDRIIIINTLLTSLPGAPSTVLMRFFSWMPGAIGRGATEQQAVVDALGAGKFSSLRWTLVRGALNARGKDERPVASADWTGAQNSWMPVSYRAMGRWMLEEAAANAFVRAAPLVSRRRR